MPYEVKPLAFKPSRLDGLSERLLASHYENNYGGALQRLNAIATRLAQLDWPVASVFEINGLKREQLIAAGSVILHEIYFDGLGEGGGDPSGELAQILERDFGSVAAWRAEFTAMAKAQAGGSGWTLLTWSPRAGRLVNQWAADHAHALPGAAPILALDMYEHAYHLDFGAKAAAYVDAFMKNIHWPRVAARCWRAMASQGAKEPSEAPDGGAMDRIAVEDLKARLDRGEAALVLDVCLAEDRAKAADMLPNARWQDPTRLDGWVDDLPRGVPIVAYCVYGFHVSGDVVAELRRRGYDAHRLAGGVAAWRAAGFPTAPTAS